ncbi:hypothetical protein LPB260_21745 [Pseudomonas sp. LPB0260]|uniref:hypothetical protein n=1 Tax=Pseudomonas sp. LPB0260 TaxID=2614442 RepID=UPI0015C2997E|nr:hypothetical protein [Pseudomonas sp. LPB0260]QLC73362.1 hypothetical protein LPB260_06795 [Pseudomonas sp. LPB0260]QLC76136.1 hypothetical protein LPB260_21745 [Pseudomonas sp. LPB0260]
MSELKDQPIKQGTRKRAEYENTRRARLALNIERSDGGTLKIPVESDMRSHEEEPEVQQNTFLAVVPMARLPGYEKYDEAPKGGLLRPGRLYIFRQGKLWRELESDGQGQLFEVDVAHWRKTAQSGGKADERKPVGAKQHLILVPMLLQGRFVGDQLAMAYSELPWTWEYIEWLEASSGRIKQRCQNIAPAWAAAVVGPEQWKATQAMPIIQITRISKGMCARELHLETLLEDPLLFNAGLTELPATSLVKQLEQRQKELAGFIRTTPPDPLPVLPPSKDLLAEYQLRGHPQLVGVMLDDPIFALRHAVAQSRLCAELLQTLNALVPHQPFGRYAEVLYSEAMPVNGPLQEFKEHIDIAALKKATLHAEREQARGQLYRQQERVLKVVERLPAVWNDFLHSHDERLLEPYAQLSELLEVLNRSPKGCDPRCIEAQDMKVSANVEKLSRQLIKATHALTKGLLANTQGELPETAKRLQALAASGMAVNPERLGLSALSFLNNAYIGQNLAAALDELLNHVATASALAVKRISASSSVTQVQLHRSFAPTFDVLSHLHSRAKRLKLMPQGEALAKNMVVLGVHGDGFSFGITAAERATLTRDNYLYANLEAKNGKVQTTSSDKLAERLGFARKDLGQVMVVAAEANDPLVADYKQWRAMAGHLDTAKALANSKSIPVLATVCAGFSLYANTVEARTLLKNKEDYRYLGGFLSGLADLGLAANNVALKLLTDAKRTGNPWHVFWERGRFQTSGFWADNLLKRTGSTWLNVSSVGSFIAMGVFTAGLFVWDAGRALCDGDDDVAMANMIAASGSGIWALYTIGLLASPWLLGLGVGLLVAGVIGSVLLADSAVEQAIKHGPFGTKQRLPQMTDPLLAYQQLLGALGEPRVHIERLQHWQEKASAADNARLQDAQNEARIYLRPKDWVVELRTPLLGQFRNGVDFNLFAREVLRTRSHASGWSYRYQPISKQKLGAVVLDGNRLLFVLPAHYAVPTESDPLRYRQAIEFSLKVYGQFQLGEAMCRADDPFPGYNRITLPQPKPRNWQPLAASTPRDRDDADDVAYWLITQRDFAKV